MGWEGSQNHENKAVDGTRSGDDLGNLRWNYDRVGDIRIGDIMIDCRFWGVIGKMYAIPIPKRQVLHTTTVSRCVN